MKMKSYRRRIQLQWIILRLLSSVVRVVKLSRRKGLWYHASRNRFAVGVVKDSLPLLPRDFQDLDQLISEWFVGNVASNAVPCWRLKSMDLLHTNTGKGDPTRLKMWNNLWKSWRNTQGNKNVGPRRSQTGLQSFGKKETRRSKWLAKNTLLRQCWIKKWKRRGLS